MCSCICLDLHCQAFYHQKLAKAQMWVNLFFLFFLHKTFFFHISALSPIFFITHYCFFPFLSHHSDVFFRPTETVWAGSCRQTINQQQHHVETCSSAYAYGTKHPTHMLNLPIVETSTQCQTVSNHDKKSWQQQQNQCVSMQQLHRIKKKLISLWQVDEFSHFAGKWSSD